MQAWTGGQYSLVRAIVGSCLFVYFASRGDVWMLAAIPAVFFAIGWLDRFAAVALCCALVWLPLRTPIVLSALVLLIHACLPRAPFLSYAARGRVDPRGNWSYPLALYTITWIVMIVGWTWILVAWTGIAWIAIPFLLFLFHPAWIPRHAPDTTDEVFYDGTCGLCHSGMRWLVAEDPTGTSFRYAPLFGDAFAAAFPDASGLPDSVIVKTADGEVLVRSDAAVHLLKRLGGLWRIGGTLFGVLPRVVRDGMYNFVARIRYRVFGRKKDACPIMPADLRSRFLVMLALVVSSSITVRAQKPDVTWTLEPLVVRNASIPDLPDRRILEIGEIYTLGEEIIFWARVAEKQYSWALLSWKNGVLRTIAMEGENAPSQYAAPGMKSLHLHHDGSWHPATRIIAGARMYLTTGGSRALEAYEWTGERVQPVLRVGESVRFGAVSYTVASVAVLQVSADGDALLRIDTSAPEKTTMLAAYIKSRVVPLVQQNTEIPGFPFPVTFRGGALGGEDIALLRGGNLIYAMSTERRGKALISVSPKGVTKLLATGDPVPGDAKKNIDRLSLLDIGTDWYLVNINFHPYRCSGTACRRITVPVPAGMEVNVLLRGGFVDGGSRGAFIAGTGRRTTEEERAIDARTTLKYRFDLLFYDGTNARIVTSHLTAGIHPASQLRAIPGARVMLFEDGWPADDTAWRGKNLDQYPWEFDVATGTLAPARPYNTTPQRYVTLKHVLYFRSATEAVVRFDDGFYRMRAAM